MHMHTCTLNLGPVWYRILNQLLKLLRAVFYQRPPDCSASREKLWNYRWDKRGEREEELKCLASPDFVSRGELWSITAMVAFAAARWLRTSTAMRGRRGQRGKSNVASASGEAEVPDRQENGLPRRWPCGLHRHGGDGVRRDPAQACEWWGMRRGLVICSAEVEDEIPIAVMCSQLEPRDRIRKEKERKGKKRKKVLSTFHLFDY